ncbi:hypothetical protein EJ110_NYTH29882 [Nymphaea thermarum]|nr:hypothetical protein EJ110_NYTH29882 [Nymphaea thermarum]
MATDYQAALIRRIKSRLRQEAGVPSFDPSDPCLQPLPTLEEVVVGFNPSPLQLRCRKCRGRLLAGIRSHVCIYCGAQQRNDVCPPSMSFTSTFAYRGLLRSLQLDGSEITSLDINTEHSIGHHATAKKETLLSELLDFELKWPQVTEDTDDNHENKVPVPNTNYANLASINLDNFFCTTSKPEIVVDTTNGQSTSDPSKEMVDISSKEFTFEAFEEIGEKAAVDTNGANESYWMADFQKAASGSQTADANVTGFLSPTVTNFLSTSKPIEGGDLSNEIQFTWENKNEAQEPNESTHLPFSTELRPDNVISVSATTENKSVNQSKESDDSLDDWQGFSGSSHLFSYTKGRADETFENGAKETNCIEQTEECDNSLDDDWQDFTGCADTPSLTSSIWSLSGGAFSHESAAQVNSIDVNHENVWRTIGADSNNVVHTAVDSVNNSEGCNQLKERTFSNPESDAFMGGKPQENNSNSLITQRDNSLDDWQEFTGSGETSMLSSDAWPLAGSASSQKPTEWIGSYKLVHETETTSKNNITLQIITDAGSCEIEQSTADLKDNIEAHHLKPVHLSNSEIGNLFGEDELVQTTAGSTGGIVKPNQLQSPFPNSKFGTLFEGSSGNHNANHEGDNSYDVWHDFTSPGDPLGATSSTSPLAGSAVVQESARKGESTNIINDMESIDSKCVITQRTVDLESRTVAQIDAESRSVREHNQSNQLPFSIDQIDAFFGGYSQKHSSSQPAKEIDDPLDDWQDFAGSGDAQEPSPSVGPNADFSGSQESMKETESAHMLRDIEFTKYIQSEPLSTELHLQKSSVNLNHMSPVPSFSNRIGDAGEMLDVSSSGEAVLNHADDTSGVFMFHSAAASTAANTTETINMLTSEMHDLSFMLKSGLSLPEKHKSSS